MSKKKFQHKTTYYNDISLKLFHQLFGLHHLHYGYFDENLKPEFKNVAAAQEKYVEELLSFIPENVKTILDVGCGTGGVASKLVEKGYQVTCIAPDPYLIEKTLENTNNKVETYTDLYENLSELKDEAYDMILMSESCQYIKPDPGWEQNKRLVKKGGYLLVADFFKIREIDIPTMSRSGQPLDNFLERAKNAKFDLISEKNITKNVGPTMDIYQEFITTKGFPILDAINEFAKRRYPMLYKILSFFLRKKILKIRQKYSEQGQRPFIDYKNYFIFLFQKKVN